MPDNIYPPYPDDTGALVIPRQLERWIDINPQGGALRKAGTYITLPAFSEAATWNGFSDIVASFNYEANHSFVLQGFEFNILEEFEQSEIIPDNALISMNASDDYIRDQNNEIISGLT